MNIIKGIVLIFNFFLMLGIVGGMERNTIELLNGFWFCRTIKEN